MTHMTHKPYALRIAAPLAVGNTPKNAPPTHHPKYPQPALFATPL